MKIEVDNAAARRRFVGGVSKWSLMAFRRAWQATHQWDEKLDARPGAGGDVDSKQ